MTGNVIPLTTVAPDPAAIEAALPWLEHGRLHEIHSHADDRGAALAFALAMLGDPAAKRGDGAIVCIHGRAPTGAQALLYGEGLVDLGIDPARLVLVAAAGSGAAGRLELWRAGLEAARCPEVAVVLLESWGDSREYDLTASRRLVLAAEVSGVAVVVMRIGATPRASAAHSRWAIASTGSRPFPTAPPEPMAPGWPAIEAKVLRRRGGPAGRCWRLEWEEADGGNGGFWRGSWRDREPERGEPGPALPGAVVSAFPGRAGAAGEDHHHRAA